MSRRGIRTPLGRVDALKAKKSNRVQRVEVEIILEKEGDSEYVYRIARTSWEPTSRRDISREWVEAMVADMLEGRDDLEGMRVRRVGVEEISTVWREPYDWEIDK